MIEWLVSSEGAFIKIMKIYAVIIGAVLTFGVSITICHFACRRIKYWLYKIGRKQ